MDRYERDLLNRLKRAAEAEKIAGMQPVTEPKDSKSMLLMLAPSLAATATVLGIMWMGNMRYEGASSPAVAEQSDR
jgi:hypothetical protein